jgi:maltose/maltodextrin transport system substrate-binding protein
MPLSHNSKGSLQVDRGGLAGAAYLQLYAVTQDKSWLEAASRIADTLKKNQFPEGRWPLRVEPQTGKVLSDYTAAQPESFLLLDELIRNHGRKDLGETLGKSVAWMLENPCKTYFWTSGFEDCGGAEERSLTGVDAIYFIEYLLRNAAAGNHYERTARDLMNYVEDQFVEWEPTGNQITPGVREQYRCYINEDAIVGLYIGACMAFHAKTREEVWLKKARAMADTLTAIQHPDGFYPTFMTHKPSKENPTELKGINYGDIWPNCSAYAGWMLLRLGEHVKAGGAR